MEQSALMLFRIREMYSKETDHADLCNALTLAGDLLEELDRSGQREPDLIGIQDDTLVAQFVELVWEGSDPSFEKKRTDMVKIYSEDRVDFTVYHGEEMYAFFSETFASFTQLIQEMRSEELSSLVIEEYLN